MLADKLRAATSAGNRIQYVGGRAVGFAGSSNVTIFLDGALTGGLSSSPTAGDLVIVYFGTGSTADRDLVISGYTEVAELYSNETYDTNLVVAYKFMGETPDETFSLIGGTRDAADAGAVVVHVFRNVDTILPFDVTSTTATGINTVLCDPPAITPSTAGAVVVSGGAGAHIRGAQTFSSSDLTAFRSAGGNDNNDVTVGAGYVEWASGAVDPAAFTFSDADSTSFSWAAVTLALSPA